MAILPRELNRPSRLPRRGRVQSGFTLLELVIVMALTSILAVAITYAFGAGLEMQRLYTARRAQYDQTQAMEQHITKLLQGTKLNAAVTDTTTFFQGLATDTGNDLGCDRLTFTTTALGIPMATQLSTDDFETQHTARGAVGGTAEVSLSTTAVGNAGGQTGLFERLQRPSDGDPTQGGTESVLAPRIDRIGFQFWDGLEWVDTWDTTTNVRRLPAAVRVSYIDKDVSGGTVRVFIVPIPASDVTSQNPVAIGGTS